MSHRIPGDREPGDVEDSALVDIEVEDDDWAVSLTSMGVVIQTEMWMQELAPGDAPMRGWSPVGEFVGSANPMTYSESASMNRIF